MTFLHPVWLLAAALFLVLAWWLRTPAESSHWHRVIPTDILNFLGAYPGLARRIILPLLAASITALALASPAVEQHTRDAFRQSSGWIMVADVSRSMTIDDTQPTRMAAMRRALLALGNASAGRPLALIVFSGDAFLVVPPAFDPTLFREHAALLEHGVVPMEGSNLARALSLATTVVQESQYVNARVFLLGDTGGMTKSAEAAAHHLASNGHRLDILNFGDTSNDAETSVNEPLANRLANQGDGITLTANVLGQLNLDPLELQERGDLAALPALQSLIWQNQSHWLLLLLLPIVLLWFGRSE